MAQKMRISDFLVDKTSLLELLYQSHKNETWLWNSVLMTMFVPNQT